MEGRKRPIRHPLYQSMLDRVEMNVVHVRLVILIITDNVLPKPTLPYRAFPMLALGRRDPVFSEQPIVRPLGEPALDQGPAC